MSAGCESNVRRDELALQEYRQLVRGDELTDEQRHELRRPLRD